MVHALVIHHDPDLIAFLSELLARSSFETKAVATLKEGATALEEDPADVLFLDLVLPDGNGLDLLRRLENRSRTQVVVIAEQPTTETIVEALRLGASDYLTQPIETWRLEAVVANIVRTFELSQEIGSLREHLRILGEFGPLLGASAAMQNVYDLISRVAPTDASVFIKGESGTGKELVAQAVHELSRRRKGPFLPVNCGAISPTLMESELFGHEKGSFTGADRQHRGVFERATGGTLFLDEITEMPIELQVKLLRVLENGKAVRVGGDQPIQLDARVVAATNRPLDQAVAEGKLREDLLYRLNVFPIQLPPLCDRGDDVLLLAGTFLGQLNKETGTAKKLTAASIGRLRAYRWPGNVRELKNIIQRAFIMVESEIRPEHLFDSGQPQTENGGAGIFLKIGTSLAQAERQLIDSALKHFDGDKKRTAESLGISLRTLYNRLNGPKENGTTGTNLPHPSMPGELPESLHGPQLPPPPHAHGSALGPRATSENPLPSISGNDRSE